MVDVPSEFTCFKRPEDSRARLWVSFFVAMLFHRIDVCQFIALLFASDEYELLAVLSVAMVRA